MGLKEDGWSDVLILQDLTSWSPVSNQNCSCYSNQTLSSIKKA